MLNVKRRDQFQGGTKPIFERKEQITVLRGVAKF